LGRVVAIILVIVGVAFLVAALLVATRPFEVHVRGQKFKCGSVLAPKDPRDIVSKRAQVRPIYKQANNRCQKRSSEYTNKAIKYLVAGVALLLIMLMIPALGRGSRRARNRRRTRL
jgi:multisubunit Na+/H+ antiporter MnhB subunit